MLRSLPTALSFALVLGHPVTPACADGELAPEVAPAAEASVRRGTSWRAPRGRSARQRSDGAWKRRRATVVRLFEQAGVAFPPARLFLRVYKAEEELEVWAAGKASAPLRRIATYRICAQGFPSGPKQRQGDGRTPEGFYTLDLYNGWSSYHLAMRVSYPNRLDRKLGRTGGAIMIHGRCASIGCLAMTDERVEELWVMANAARKRRAVVVHVFPGRELETFIAGADHPPLRRFWLDLKAGHDAFEATHRLPRIDVRGRRYAVRSR